MEGDAMTNIPSDEEFAKAKARMRELDRNVKEANERALQYFRELCPGHSHNLYLVAEGDRRFRAYIFYKRDQDVQAYKNKGVDTMVENFIYAELERQGRGKREDITVAFEFDSDENVTANYEGNYFLRLR
jgi:hypothetical protein